MQIFYSHQKQKQTRRNKVSFFKQRLGIATRNFKKKDKLKAVFGAYKRNSIELGWMNKTITSTCPQSEKTSIDLDTHKQTLPVPNRVGVPSRQNGASKRKSRYIVEASKSDLTATPKLNLHQRVFSI
mmetsp:Transcript_41689/g.48125  ORF Transcript_41689/g.48125 Transcript_41689/m.48125 type:complete len:127 (-) Transcript_41689:60-440(-)